MALTYLGTVYPIPTPSAPDAASTTFRRNAHYVTPERVHYSLLWAHAFSDTFITSHDPTYVFPTGEIISGVRHNPGGNTKRIAAYCDVPGLFTNDNSSAGGRLYLYTTDTSGVSSETGHFNASESSTFFTNIANDKSVAFYKNGEVWVYLADPGGNDWLYRCSTSTTTPTHVLDFDDYSLGTIRCVCIGDNEIYVLSGSSSPWTFTVIENVTYTVTSTQNLSMTTSGFFAAYSSQDGLIYFYADRAPTDSDKGRLYELSGTTLTDLGIIPNSVYDTLGLGAKTPTDFCVSSNLLVIAYRSTDYGVRYWSLNSTGSDYYDDISTVKTGTLSVTSGNDSLSASGSTTILGSLSVTNLNDVTSIIGTLGTLENRDSLNASGWVGSNSGILDYSNNNDVLSAVGSPTNVGILNVILPDDVMSGSGFLTDVAIPSIGSRVPFYYIGEDPSRNVRYIRPIYRWEALPEDDFDVLGEDDLDRLDDEAFEAKWDNMTKEEFIAWKKRRFGH